ncbi:hypothetical protein ACA910_010215 [Epithemia clementina (nom. ined.)]
MGTGECPVCPQDWWDRMLPALLYLAATLEVLVRGFMIGFGFKMLHFMILDGQNENLDRLGHRLRVAFVFGISTAFVIIGSSLFLPTKLRIKWFQYDDL